MCGMDRDAGGEKRARITRAVMRGFNDWEENPHNKKWRKRIDGTPIGNDLLVSITASVYAELRDVLAEFAAVCASTPTLTAEDFESMIRSALSFTDSQNPSQVSLSYARMAERGNAILSAKSQKGGDTPSAAWDRAIDECENILWSRREKYRYIRVDDITAIRALRGKYEEPKSTA